MAKCKFCGKEIMWTKEGRKNVPVEMDGGVHRCDEMMTSMKSTKVLTRDEISEDIIKQYEENMRKQRQKK